MINSFSGSSSELDEFDLEIDTSEEFIRDQLQKIGLVLANNCSLEWLSCCIRRSITLAVLIEKNKTPEPSAEIRKVLRKQSKITEDVWSLIFGHNDQISIDVDNIILDYTSRLALHDYDDIKLPEAYVRYKNAIMELDWLSRFLRDVDREMQVRTGQRGNPKRRRLKVRICYYFASIFEAGFSKKITINGFPDNKRHDQPTPFALFSLTFGGKYMNKHDLAGVLTEARNMHRRVKFDFEDGLIYGQK